IAITNAQSRHRQFGTTLAQTNPCARQKRPDQSLEPAGNHSMGLARWMDRIPEHIVTAGTVEAFVEETDITDGVHLRLREPVSHRVGDQRVHLLVTIELIKEKRGACGLNLCQRAGQLRIELLNFAAKIAPQYARKLIEQR